MEIIQGRQIHQRISSQYEKRRLDGLSTVRAMGLVQRGKGKLSQAKKAERDAYVAKLEKGNIVNEARFVGIQDLEEEFRGQIRVNLSMVEQP